MSFLNIFSVTEGKERYIRNLINRMSTVDNAKSSDESISFKAHREAESLSDKDLVPILVDHISNSSSQEMKSSRKAAYFMLSKLIQKHENLEALQFLINQLKLETDKYVISSMLDRISELNKTESIELDPIFQFLQHQDWTIRHSAISALKKSRNPQARKVILEIILRNKDDFRKNKEDIIYSVSTLSDIGIIEDLELLEELSINKIRDIRDSSTYAIESINKRQ
jgi:HEAT repeat protein